MIWNLALVLTLATYPAIVVATGTVEDRTSARVEETGTLSGTIRFLGEVPDPAPLSVSVDPEVCAVRPIRDETLLVYKATSGVKNAVVWLEGVPSVSHSTPVGEAETPILDQRGCRYDPHVLLVRVNQEAHILNSDGILHNTHTRSTSNRPINKAQPGLLKRIKVTFRRPEIMEVGCDAHEWMKAWIVVAEHDQYTITSDSGEFRLSDVPPGTYTLQVWHESLGTLEAQVTVKEGIHSRLELEFTTPPT